MNHASHKPRPATHADRIEAAKAFKRIRRDAIATKRRFAAWN